jgi:hypothetical protein
MKLDHVCRVGKGARAPVVALLQRRSAAIEKQRTSDAASFVKRVDESAQIDPSRGSAAEKPWIASSSSQTKNVELSKSQSTSGSLT